MNIVAPPPDELWAMQIAHEGFFDLLICPGCVIKCKAVARR